MSGIFKVKGTAIISTKKFFDAEFGEDYFVNNFPRYYPNSNLLASSWYDMNPIVQWLNEAADSTNSSFRNLVLKNTTYVLENDLNGVYKFFIKLGGIKRVLDASPLLAKSYSNCLEIKIIENITGYYKSEIIIPDKFSDFAIHGQEGSLSSILKVCGKRMTDFKIISKDIFEKDQTVFSKIVLEMKYEDCNK